MLYCSIAFWGKCKKVNWDLDGRINGQAMITHRFSLDEIEEAFKYTAEHPEEAMKTIVKA